MHFTFGPFQFGDLEDCLQYNYQLEGDPSEICFTHPSALENAKSDSLVWIGSIKSSDEKVINNLIGNVVIAHHSLPNHVHPSKGQVIVRTSHPKETFIQILNKLFVGKPKAGIHPTAIIDESAIIGEGVSIGPYSIIGKCTIGDFTQIHSHCVVHDHSNIGPHVIIKSHSTIGSDGFGYSKNADGHYIKFPHLGGVIIQEYVEIGSNTCIDRGTLGNTMIGAHSKIDNLVHVAHNVHLGKNCIVVANVLIGGSTIIGNDCWIAPSVTIRDGLNIVSGVTVGMAALVTKNLDKPGIYLGNPAKLKE